MGPFLLLFDIDGTILKVQDGLSKSIFQSVFCNFFRRKQLPLDFDFAGRTDLEILFLLSLRYDVDFSMVEANLDSIWKSILSEFKQKCTRKEIHLCPFVKEFIEKLSNYKNVALGLLTGNFKESAYYKLKLVELDGYFPFGAFGNESINRSTLHKIAIARANEYYSKQIFNIENTFVIGDSIADITSAKENGIKVVAVATGTNNANQLYELEPNLLVHDFNEWERILNFLQI
ncbi:MAG: HAD family hydrolase [Candidatus Kapaibacteriota bacterium]